MFLIGAGFLASMFYHRAGVTAAYTTVALGLNLAFAVGWHTLGQTLDNVERTAALDQVLDEASVPEDAPVYFADQRPDARLQFYFRRRSEHLVDPADIVSRSVERRRSDRWLQEFAVQRAGTLLSASQPVYLVFDREHLPLLESLPPRIRGYARVLSTIDLDQKPDGDDWVVLTNVLRDRADLDRGRRLEQGVVLRPPALAPSRLSL